MDRSEQRRKTEETAAELAAVGWEMLLLAVAAEERAWLPATANEMRALAMRLYDKRADLLDVMAAMVDDDAERRAADERARGAALAEDARRIRRALDRPVCGCAYIDAEGIHHFYEDRTQ